MPATSLLACVQQPRDFRKLRGSKPAGFKWRLVGALYAGYFQSFGAAASVHSIRRGAIQKRRRSRRSLDAVLADWARARDSGGYYAVSDRTDSGSDGDSIREPAYFSHHSHRRTQSSQGCGSHVVWRFHRHLARGHAGCTWSKNSRRSTTTILSGPSLSRIRHFSPNPGPSRCPSRAKIRKLCLIPAKRTKKIESTCDA